MEAKEEKLTEQNKLDEFKCSMCGEKSTRESILKRWIDIPFGKESKKEYYCGCMGWD